MLSVLQLAVLTKIILPQKTIIIIKINNNKQKPDLSEVIRIYFHNIQGFRNKYATLLNHTLSKQFDVYIFQESNIKETHDNLYDNWSIAGLLAKNISFKDSETWKRGTIIGHIPELTSENLKIYDGDSFATPIIGYYCGNLLPSSQTSSTNSVLIHFVSDFQ